MALSLRFSALLSLFCINSVYATFGITSGSGFLSVDTGVGLVFRVKTSNGDIISLKYNGKEWQDQSKFTHISSGLGSSTVTSKVSGNNAIVTVETPTLTQCYVAVKGQSAIYIGTYATAEPTVGELRFIARLKKSVLPKGFAASDIAGGVAIEASDVFKVGGQTRSKFYSSVPFINDRVHGVTGNGVGAYIVMPGNAYETSSGGPFMRDINNQSGTQQEVYFYMNSGHMKTETYRTGFFGPYALVFTSGAAPSGNLDTSFFAGLGLTGYVAASGRGTVKGSVTGIALGFEAVVALKNNSTQYWGTASSGDYTISGVNPGTYTATLFKKKLEVGTATVTVSAGKTATLDMKSTENIRNADTFLTWFLRTEIQTMHPSDSRMSDWKSATFTIGSSSPASFPMAQFTVVNNAITIKWTANSSQIGSRTLRIRTTSSFNGGRPTVKVNSWSGRAPAAPTKIDSRGVTRGT
ncbi:Rhamnogalacturonase B, N-terminal-domain-containing protein [Rhizoctonia solani]|nr:Rhamnogalacturonase B, N-terminal-domain-containing protein [Rhizoctonia solani]